MSQKISFGNSYGYKINNYSIKEKLLNYLIENIEISKLNLKKIETEKDLLNIKNNKYYIYPNILGDNYIFLAKKIKNIYYSVLIDISKIDNFFNINYNNVNIISLKIRLCEDIYNGTIFDGKLINLGGVSNFIINVCYLLKGNEILKLSNQAEKLNQFLNESIIFDSNMNVIEFMMNKIYNLDEIDYVVNNKIKNSRFNITSLTFIPESSNIKYIHYICEVSEKNIKKYFLAKHIRSDVISLYAIDNTERKKIGIAHIPNIKCSKLCNQFISKNDYTKVLCKLNINFKKWQPIEIIPNDKSNIADYTLTLNTIKNIVTKY